jgi:heptosyltransferase-1
MTGTYHNILIIKPSALGDIALTLPALAALRNSFPDAHISWLVRPEYAGLLEGHPYLDQIILFDRKQMAGMWRRPKALCQLRKLIRQLRREQFDIVFDFQGLLRTAFLGWVARSPQRIGMANAREGATLFYTKKIKPDTPDGHLVDHYLALVKGVVGQVDNTEFFLPQDAGAEAFVRAMLLKHHIELGKYIVLVPGSAHQTKCWPVERFALLADHITHTYGLPVITVGSPSEKETASCLQSKARTSVLNVAGDTNLKQLVSLLRHARLVVSNDTGPGHIAAGLGVPLVMLFSWSNPARIYPYGRPECMLAVDPFQRGSLIKNHDPYYNVANITFQEVWQKSQEQLEIP